jgi:hypothetical protein
MRHRPEPRSGLNWEETATVTTPLAPRIIDPSLDFAAINRRLVAAQAAFAGNIEDQADYERCWAAAEQIVGADVNVLLLELERLQAVVDAAVAWRRMRAGTPTRPKPESAALIAAVDALTVADGN